MLGKISAKQQFVITATCIGSTLEWFEFALFGMMAPFMIDVFLPTGTQATTLIYPSLLTLSIIARPIGGFVFGRMGDRKGRKFALLRTIVCMIIPLLVTALLPSYNQIGITALFLLAFVFTLQGFSMGGEFPGSAVFLVESAKRNTHGYFGSWIYFGAFLGMLLAAIEVHVLNNYVSHEAFVEWGWRFTFFLSALIATFALFLRRMLHETHFFEEAKEYGHLDKEPLFDTFHKYKKALLYGIGLVCMETAGFNLLILFATPYYTKTLNIPYNQVTIIQLFIISLLVIVTPFIGKASVRIGSKRLSKIALYGLILTPLPIYYLITYKIFWMILVGQGIIAIFFATYISNLPALICSLFPVKVRYSAVATAMNLSILIFAILGIALITFFIHHSDSLLWPSYYWIGASLLSLLCLTRVKEPSHES